MEQSVTGRRNVFSIAAFAIILVAVAARMMVFDGVPIALYMGAQVLAILLGAIGLYRGGRDSEFGLVAIVAAIAGSILWFWEM